MSRSPSRFKQADVTRFVRALRACGLAIARTEVGPDGRIVVIHGPAVSSADISELDAWRAKRDARSA